MSVWARSQLTLARSDSAATLFPGWLSSLDAGFAYGRRLWNTAPGAPSRSQEDAPAVCNEYERSNHAKAFTDEEFSRLVPIQWAGGLIPNAEPAGSVRISETAPIARRSAEGLELSTVPWAWKGPRGAPVFNFKSEGRSFANSDRVLIPASAFYEYTPPVDAEQKLKHKHRFALEGEPWFWIASLVKDQRTGVTV